jgi:hypothetical protein
MFWILPNLNDTTPPAPDGRRNTKWQHGDPYTDTDGIRRRDTSSYEPATGGVSVKTGDYTLVAADCGKFIVLDSASPHTFILPNPVPFPEWTAALICRGAGTLSVDANGLLLDGVGTSPVPTLTAGQGILVQTDGSNYASFAGKGSGVGGAGQRGVCFGIKDGSTGTDVADIAIAPAAGSVTKCKIVTKASDPSVDLTFKIKKNGVDVFSADPTITHGTASGTITTSTSLTSVPLAVAADDLFTLDITSGSSAWQFTAQLE